MARIWAAWGFLATLALSAPAGALSPDDARHLLSRSGYGASAAEIAELAPLTREQAVDLLLSRTRTEPVVTPPEFLSRPWPPYRDFPSMTQEQRDHFIQARRVELQTLKAWWYAEMIATPSPLTERMTLFWHNHFVSAFEAVGFNIHRMWDQNKLFRREAAGSFAVLVYEILRDPIMLRYLDNSSNRKGRPNENLARELLELFTLGEGHYTEADIKEIARALTGRTIERTTDFGFRFAPGIHDDGVKRFLGRQGAFNGDDVARIVLEQPRTAEFVAEKLWREFVSPAAPPRGEIARVAAALRESRYQLKPALRALFLAGDFWAPANRGALVKSPTALIVGLHRDLGLPVVDLQALPVYGRRLGQDLFEPPNVKGWPGDALWITPALLVNRHDVLTRLLANRDLVPQQRGRAVNLRVAGDAWRGVPRMVVTVNDGATRETKDIDFATDTERYGNLADRNDWVWRVVRVPVDGAVEKVGVEFVNDGAAPLVDGVRRGDRNLFVDWIEIDGETFPARAAKQTTSNPNCGTQRPGDLHCNGTLEFDLAAIRKAGAASTGAISLANGAMMGGVMANGTMGGAMAAAPVPAAAARAAPARTIHLDAGAWRATLPAPWRDAGEIWRALTPLPPVAGPLPADLEAALRAAVLDPVYQVQ
jgi:uncharacterized protein (DUF1800 family)